MKTKRTDKEEIKRLSAIVKKIRREKIELQKKIDKLEDELYTQNATRANNHKTALRVKDIVAMYPISKSTVWLYVNRGDITPIKNSSRVTTFDAKEVKAYFKSINKDAYDITPTPKNIKIAIINSYTNKPFKKKTKLSLPIQ